MNFKEYIYQHKVLCILVVIVLAVFITSIFMIIDYRNQASPVSDIIENEVFEDKSDNEPPWKPEKHDYNLDNIKSEYQKKVYYDENGNVISKFGIDISYHQKNIDWQLLKDEGIDFVMLRIGYRGYESGDLFIDKKFDEYISAAQQIGIDVGVYFFSQSLNTAESVEEAEFVIDILKNYHISYPVAYDWEPVLDEGSRTPDDTFPEMTECCVAFCNKIKEAGYTAIVYANRNQAMQHYDLQQITGFDLWLAEYMDEPMYPYEFTMWQYSCDGRLKGIPERVDLNICFKDYSADNPD